MQEQEEQEEKRIEKEILQTERFLKTAKKNFCAPKKFEKIALEFIDVAERYFNDGKWFFEKKDLLSAFGALNYAFGWLDAGEKLGFWKKQENKKIEICSKNSLRIKK